MIRVDSLPDDMQQLLADLAEDAGIELPETLPLRRAPLAVFPSAAIGTSSGDGRDQHYVRSMVGATLPPLVVADGFLIDGRHRIAALRLGSAESAEYVDLTGIMPAPQVPRIGAMLDARGAS